MGQEEAASGGRFVSCFAPVRKNPNGTDGRSALCAGLARAIRRANRAGANAGAGPCDTREKGTRRRQAGGSANGTEAEGGTICRMQTGGASARQAERGGARRAMTSHEQNMTFHDVSRQPRRSASIGTRSWARRFRAMNGGIGAKSVRIGSHFGPNPHLSPRPASRGPALPSEPGGKAGRWTPDLRFAPSGVTMRGALRPG